MNTYEVFGCSFLNSSVYTILVNSNSYFLLSTTVFSQSGKIGAHVVGVSGQPNRKGLTLGIGPVIATDGYLLGECPRLFWYLRCQSRMWNLVSNYDDVIFFWCWCCVIPSRSSTASIQLTSMEARYFWIRDESTKIGVLNLWFISALKSFTVQFVLVQLTRPEYVRVLTRWRVREPPENSQKISMLFVIWKVRNVLDSCSSPSLDSTPLPPPPWITYIIVNSSDILVTSNLSLERFIFGFCKGCRQITPSANRSLTDKIWRAIGRVVHFQLVFFNLFKCNYYCQCWFVRELVMLTPWWNYVVVFVSSGTLIST